jgi:cytochrome c-type biogenesis protein CcmH/NrfF
MNAGLAVLLWGLTLFVTIIGILDMIGRRQDRKQQRR